MSLANVVATDNPSIQAIIRDELADQPASWNYAAEAGGIANTTARTIAAAAGAGLRNYITSLDLVNHSATATEVAIRDGAGGAVLWRQHVASGRVLTVTFRNPLKSTINTLLEVVCLTTASQTYFNAQGYIAA